MSRFARFIPLLVLVALAVSLAIVLAQSTVAVLD